MSRNGLLWPSQGTKPEERFDKYKWLRLPSQGVGGTGDGPPPATADNIKVVYPPVADVTYQFYKFYQIKKNQTQGNETNVPLVILVDLPVSSLQELTDGFDVRVFDSAGSPIPYEIIDMVVLGDGSATFEVWLNMPLVNDGEFVQLAFGKLGDSDGSTPNLVYDANYTSVYHLNGIGDDSTVNAEDMTIFGTTTVPAKIGTGLDFNGTVNDYLIRNPYNSFPTTEITCELWIQSTGVNDGFISYAVGMGGLANHYAFFNQANIVLTIIGAGSTTFQDLNDGLFHLLVSTWRSSDGELLLYHDGIEVFSATVQTGNSFTNGGANVLGQEQDDLGGGFNGLQALDGILEEVKFSNNIRNADYVFSTFKNQSDNTAFWFETPILTVGETHLLVDDLGNNIVTGVP